MWGTIVSSFVILVTSGSIIYKYKFDKDENKVKTIIDTFTIEEMELFLNIITKPDDDGDTIAMKLLKLYKTFPPSEKQLQAMSQIQQEYDNTGGRYNFVSTMLYAIATLSIMEKLECNETVDV